MSGVRPWAPFEARKIATWEDERLTRENVSHSFGNTSKMLPGGREIQGPASLIPNEPFDLLTIGPWHKSLSTSPLTITCRVKQIANGGGYTRRCVVSTLIKPSYLPGNFVCKCKQSI